jgi:hypothetical protein
MTSMFIAKIYTTVAHFASHRAWSTAAPWPCSGRPESRSRRGEDAIWLALPGLVHFLFLNVCHHVEGIEDGKIG